MNRLVFLIPLSLLSTIGCGTLRNVSPASGQSHAPNLIYGGVLDDVDRVNYAAKDLGQFPNSERPVPTNLKDIALYSADVPISAIGDTLTLNMVVVNDYARRRDD